MTVINIAKEVKHMARNKQLNIDDRKDIQNGLDDGKTFTQISKDTGINRSTISKEVKLHSHKYKDVDRRCHYNNCANFDICQIRYLCSFCTKITSTNSNPKCRSCDKCNELCYNFKEAKCKLLDKTPHVCNGCSKRRRCRYMKVLYYANLAQEEKDKNYKESHSGFYVTEEELSYIDELYSGLTKNNGQSIHAITVNNKDKAIRSEKTVYNYVNAGLLSIRPIDLPKAVRYRKRKNNTREHKVDKACRINRTYEDFSNFIEGSNNYVEMDTVEGNKGGKAITTLIFKSCNLQLSFIKEHNSAYETKKVFNYLYETLGKETYERLFYVILTDNGSEFSDPLGIEFDSDGNRRSYVFYCDAKHSEQKGTCEKNHEEIRKIIPKGTSMQEYDQNDINLMMSHINSYVRKKLKDISPYESFSLLYGNDILPKLGITKIPPNEVILKPSLLKK